MSANVNIDKQQGFADAENWVNEYIKSDLFEKKLLECKSFSINKLTLITKLLLEKGFEWPHPLFLLWQKSEAIFYFKIRNNSNDYSKLRQISIEEYLNKKHSPKFVKNILKKWDYNQNASFSSYIIGINFDRTANYFSDYDKKRKDNEDYKKHIKINWEQYFYEPNSEKIWNILYTLFVSVDDYPHKKLIFLTGYIFYFIDQNVKWRTFYKNHSEDDLYFLCIKIMTKYEKNEAYSDFFSSLRIFNKIELSKLTEHMYSGNLDENIQIRELAGNNTPVGEIDTNIFFSAYHMNNGINYKELVGAIAQWNRRLRIKVRGSLNGDLCLKLNDLRKDL